MSFACSSSNLAPSIFFSFVFVRLWGMRWYSRADTREQAFTPLQNPMSVLCGRYLFHVNRIYSVKKPLVSLQFKKKVCDSAAELKCVSMAVREADETGFLIFICLPFLLCIFGGFTQWPLCLGQWVHPSNPLDWERNHFLWLRDRMGDRERDSLGKKGQADEKEWGFGRGTELEREREGKRRKESAREMEWNRRRRLNWMIVWMILWDEWMNKVERGQEKSRTVD